MENTTRSAAATRPGEGGAPLLEVRNLSTIFKEHNGIIRAVNDVSFTLGYGESMGVIGESGCGKTVMSSSIMRLVQSPPGFITGGEILFHMDDGSVTDIAKLDTRDDMLYQIRGRYISMIFQTPMTAFSPVHSVGSQIMEMLKLHTPLDKSARRREAEELLERVNIPQPGRILDSYPHQLSGGMCQRAMIAMAIAARPKILIADEPTTAVDVTVQAQILELLREKQRELDMAIIFITHDLGVIAQIAKKVAVMYMGNIVERADVYSLFDHPSHPYTNALLRSKPDIRRGRERLVSIQGSVPSGRDYPEGCVFRARCDRKLPMCDVRMEMPPEVEVLPGHFVRCYRYIGGEEENS